MMIATRWLLLAAVWIALTAARAEDATVTHKFKLAISSQVSKDRGWETTMAYRFQRSKDELLVVLDQIVQRGFLEGEWRESRMSREGTYIKEKDQPARKLDLSVFIQRMHEQSFGTPICRIELDATGKELKRTLIAGSASKELVTERLIATLRFLHPPFPEDQAKWTHSFGPLGKDFPGGKLEYERINGKAKDGRLVTVAVSGMVLLVEGNDNRKSRVEYDIKGEQIYDQQLKEWVRGELAIDVADDRHFPFFTKYQSRISMEMVQP